MEKSGLGTGKGDDCILHLHSHMLKQLPHEFGPIKKRSFPMDIFLNGYAFVSGRERSINAFLLLQWQRFNNSAGWKEEKVSQHNANRSPLSPKRGWPWAGAPCSFPAQLMTTSRGPSALPDISPIFERKGEAMMGGSAAGRDGWNGSSTKELLFPCVNWSSLWTLVNHFLVAESTEACRCPCLSSKAEQWITLRASTM